MSKLIDITNQRFGQLVALQRVGSNKQGATWRCRCDCGQETIAACATLTAGKSASCGHGRWIKFRERNFKHGGSKTKTYLIWKSMLQRCRNPRKKDYKWYGGRGIRICDRWQIFSNFLADMGECPLGYSIERIDVNGHYEPANCMWIPRGDQNKNRRLRTKS